MDLYRYSAAFPELVIPVLGHIKKFAKLTKVFKGKETLKYCVAVYKKHECTRRRREPLPLRALHSFPGVCLDFMRSSQQQAPGRKPHTQSPDPPPISRFGFTSDRCCDRSWLSRPVPARFSVQVSKWRMMSRGLVETLEARGTWAAERRLELRICPSDVEGLEVLRPKVRGKYLCGAHRTVVEDSYDSTSETPSTASFLRCR